MFGRAVGGALVYIRQLLRAVFAGAGITPRSRDDGRSSATSL